MGQWIGYRVLIFGDSLSDGENTPGGQLGRLVIDGGGAVRRDARSGRSARSFFANEPASDLIAADLEWKPTHVVVMLGTNEIASGTTPARAREAWQRLAAEFAGVPTIAIGPPSFERPNLNSAAPPFVDAMRSVWPAFVDARPLTPAAGRSADGVHFTQAGARDFAAKLHPKLFELAHPSPFPVVPVIGGIAVALALWFAIGGSSS